jgi:hypothetical protein
MTKIMYEYVITAGPGIMLEHGTTTPDEFHEIVGPASKRAGQIVLVGFAPEDACVERFH